MTAALARLWGRLWLVPGTALELAAARVVFALHALWIVLSRDLPANAALPPEFFARLEGAMRWRYLLFEGHPGLERALEALLVVSLVALALGWRARTNALLSALLLYHLAPLETWLWNSEPYERGSTINVLALVVLSATPCGDALVLRLGRAVAPREERDPRDYGWGLRLIQLLLAEVYLFSAYAKLRAAGWDWVSAQNLREWLLVFQQQDQVAVFRSLGTWMAERPWACLGAAWFGMLLDLGFVLAVFVRRARVVIVPAALVFHAGILFAMNIAFLNVPQLLIFVDWEAVRARWRGWKRSGKVGNPAAV